MLPAGPDQSDLLDGSLRGSAAEAGPGLADGRCRGLLPYEFVSVGRAVA